MKKNLNLQESRLDLKYFILLVLVSFAFSIAIRTYWVSSFSGVENFQWNNELMINTTDGYYFAEGARDILKGIVENSDGSPTKNPLSQLTALLVKYLPFSFETVILWMSAVLSSLIVIPIMLIGRALGKNYMGFVASLLGGIAWSYYNRTMAGYYDTDMLIMVFACFVLWSLVFNLTYRRNRYLLLIPFFIITYLYWYGQSYSLSMAMIFILFFYTVIFERKEIFNYKILIFMFISVANIFIWLKIFLVIFSFLAFHFKKDYFNRKIIFIILGVSFILVLFTGGFDPILQKLNAYLFRNAYAADLFDNIKLNFYGLHQTVREAGKIPFETFANRISGNSVIFLFSIIGYILLVIRHKIMLLALPMVGLGFLAMNAGLRFTIYAVPIMALGISYLIFFISDYIQNRNFKIGFIFMGVTAILYPNIKHVTEYKMPTVFLKQEVTVLDKFRKIANRDDYIVSWWDYGFPIRYYADVKTLIDGGANNGEANFPVSFALTKDQISSSNMARLVVEHVENGKGNFLISMMKKYNTIDINIFLESLQLDDVVLPKKTRDIYFYLPNRMMRIFTVVERFSNLNLKTGDQYQRSFFYKTNSFEKAGDEIDLGNNIVVSKTKNTVKVNDTEVPIKNFVTTYYGANSTLVTKIEKMNPKANLSVIYMKNYNQFLVVDTKIYNSTYIQLFVLEQFNEERFEPVILNPYAKIYKLKM